MAKTRRLTAGLVIIACSAALAAAEARAPGEKNLLVDMALVAGATTVAVLILPSVRHGVFHHWSPARVWENFRDPIHRAIEGGRDDHNSFWINYVGHPLCFAGLALYLKQRGYRNGGALLFTQVQNVAWEYIIEGGIWKPSAKDLISDLAGSLAGIYILSPLSDLGEKRIESGDRRWGNRLLYWLNPFKKINRLLFGKKEHCSLFLCPTRKGISLSLLFK